MHPRRFVCQGADDVVASRRVAAKASTASLMMINMVGLPAAQKIRSRDVCRVLFKSTWIHS